jgi:concanavalin A-like lectin/glucanase superfamily protein
MKDRKLLLQCALSLVTGMVVTLTPALGQTCTPPPPGMVSWWRADGNALDAVGNNDGTPVGNPTYAAGRVGQAFSLDGDDDYVDVGRGFNLDTMTVEAWIYVDPATNTGDRRVFGKDNFLIGPSWNRKLFVLKSNTEAAPTTCQTLNVPVFGVVWGTTEDAACAVEQLTRGWHHLAGVRDTSAGRLEIWVNGELAGNTTPTVIGRIDSDVNAVIGTVSSTTLSEHFFGLIDELTVFSRALTAEEIRAIASAGPQGKCQGLGVSIDIKPGSDPNAINLGSSGVIPIAILSSSAFDATVVIPDSVRLAGAEVKVVGKSSKYLCHDEDVNGDGRLDKVCQVLMTGVPTALGDTIMVLEAVSGGVDIWGYDDVKIVP